MKKFISKTLNCVCGYVIISNDSFLFGLLGKNEKIGEYIKEFKKAHSLANGIAYTLGKLSFFLCTINFCLMFYELFTSGSK
ncbi:MAG: hypothetical protein Nk1A_6870 [Endomicrobiia bacterium]|nr:MAG: hypothetical protein Nk1A_6870 [Endomicrobiia bacterium]